MSENKKNELTRSQVKNYLKQIDNFFEQTPLRNIISEMNHLLQKGNRLLTFPIDLYESGDFLVIQAELPGINKNQIVIEVQGDYLRISVKDDVLEEEQNDTESYYRRERSLTEATRLIKLPYPIKKKDTKVSYQNGILEIRALRAAYTNDILSID